MKNDKKMRKKGTKRATSLSKTEVLHEKNLSFFTPKDLPASQKTENLHEK